MDFLGVLVEGDMLATFVNCFCVVVALDFVCNLAYIVKGLK